MRKSSFLRAAVLVGAIAAVGCTKKDGGGSGTSAASSSAPAKPGEPRKVAIEAGSHGFDPSTIEGAPGEKLILVFTRTINGECMAQVKLEGGKPIDLPKDQA